MIILAHDGLSEGPLVKSICHAALLHFRRAVCDLQAHAMKDKYGPFKDTVLWNTILAHLLFLAHKGDENHSLYKKYRSTSLVCTLQVALGRWISWTEQWPCCVANDATNVWNWPSMLSYETIGT